MSEETTNRKIKRAMETGILQQDFFSKSNLKRSSGVRWGMPSLSLSGEYTYTRNSDSWVACELASPTGTQNDKSMHALMRLEKHFLRSPTYLSVKMKKC